MKNKSKDLAIILAAGKGSRLNTDLAKPLFKFNSIPIIDHLINAISSLSNTDILTVVGYKKDSVINHIKDKSFHVIQSQQKGTADAVLKCADYIKKYNNIFIFVGDTPCLRSRTIKEMLIKHKKLNADCSFLYSKFPFVLPYGRLFFNSNNHLTRLVEISNLSKDEICTRNLFTSQYLFKSDILLDSIGQIEIDSKTQEYNLTEIINICIQCKYKINPIFVEKYWELMGINSIADIEQLNKIIENER
tara:strand:+ start:150 stop:890 length:741 start_codon:yes stop_codon:yes gene_type:complete